MSEEKLIAALRLIVDGFEGKCIISEGNKDNSDYCMGYKIGSAFAFEQVVDIAKDALANLDIPAK